MSLLRPLRLRLRSILKRYGYAIYKRPFLPKGVDAFDCIRSHWPDWQPSVILDVGANVGQTYDRLKPAFPSARLHCFEPIPAAHAILSEKLRNDTLSCAHRLALSDRAGTAEIHAHPSSDRSSLTPEIVGTCAENDRLQVETDTLDHVCERLEITSIGLLKIDVEGHEMSVLSGARQLLAAQKVEFLVIEAGLIDGNPRFTPLTRLNQLLLPQGYWLIGLCEQYGDRFSQGAEFCNAVYCRQKRLGPAS